jgi:hypothetical protein
MKRLTVVALMCLVPIAAAGCKRSELTPTKEEMSAKCPGCGAAMKAGEYCAKCNAVASTGKTVRCEKCKKDYKEGQFCPVCNAFMFDQKAKCQGCGAEATKGAFCDKCKTYVGVTGVGYCDKCKKPYPEATGCPVCSKMAT